MHRLYLSFLNIATQIRSPAFEILFCFDYSEMVKSKPDVLEKELIAVHELAFRDLSQQGTYHERLFICR